ncbi:MAG: tetratricopeptide repeat protein [Cyclobacteriaceae bacterium]
MNSIRKFFLLVLASLPAVLAYSADTTSRSRLDSLNALSKAQVCGQIALSDSIADHVIQLAKEAGYPGAESVALKNKAGNLICQGKSQQAIVLLKMALQLAQEANELKTEGAILNNMAAAFHQLSKMDSAKWCMKQLFEVARATKDSVLLASAYKTKSNIHIVLTENDSVVHFAMKGLAIAEAIRHDELHSAFLTIIGNAHLQNETFDQALEYYLRAREIMLKMEGVVNMGLIYHNIGTCFTEISQPDSAFKYFEMAIEASQLQNRQYQLAYHYMGLAFAYMEVKNYEQAISYNLKSKEISLAIGEKRSLATVLSNLAECYTLTGRPELGISNAQEAIRIDQAIGDKDKEADGYFLLSQAYEKSGKYAESLEAYKKFYSLDSNNLASEKSSTIFDLETKYQTEKKEAEIESLSQKAAIQALEISQKNQAIVIGIIVVLLVTMAALFIYKQRESVRRSQQIELEQRFLRSQLNPHFIFNALLAIQNFMLKNNAQSAALYLTKFSKLMRQILENSREEFIPVAAEIEMLSNYMDIHKLRLKDSFDYKIEVDEKIDVEADTIPPMFVQPFVENAIEHGLINTKDHGLIEIKLGKENEHISIAIRDNGGGLAISSPELKEHNSLASTIIRERMALFNKNLKDKIQLALDNITNEQGDILGTKVELKVPFHYL